MFGKFGKWDQVNPLKRQELNSWKQIYLRDLNLQTNQDFQEINSTILFPFIKLDFQENKSNDLFLFILESYLIPIENKLKNLFPFTNVELYLILKK